MQKLFVATLLGICLLAAVIFYLNAIALEHFLYWTFWWYDIVMHFLGGVLIGSGVAWLLTRFDRAQKLSRYSFCMWTIVVVLLVGAGWELFEYTNGFFIGEVNVVKDTIGDLVMDTLGGIVGWSALAFIFRKRQDASSVQLSV